MNKSELDKAIAYFEHFEIKPLSPNTYVIGQLNEFEEHERMCNQTALKCLREARERAEGCWHCRGIDMVGVISCTEIDTKGIGKTRLPESTPYNYCPNCGRWLEADDDLQEYADTPEAWAKRRIEGGGRMTDNKHE